MRGNLFSYKKMVLTALLCGSFIQHGGAAANEAGLLDYRLRNLDTLELDSLSRYRGLQNFIADYSFSVNGIPYNALPTVSF